MKQVLEEGKNTSDKKPHSNDELTHQERRIGEPVYKTHAFDALKANFESQVGLLRMMTQIDLQIFTGYITLQLALGGWLSTHTLKNWWLRIGMLLIDLGFSGIASKLLYNNYRRRKEVATTVANLNEALGFTEKGIYIEDKTINSPTVFRPWFWWYFVGIGICLLGILFIIFKSGN
ncbi:MAG: hypothetical protein MOB07_12220 [Acidobacteria bacterium]|nr:hypothetical protein [Acidobacteriota bacterium]